MVTLAVRVGAEALRPHPKAPHHSGTCLQCGDGGDTFTVVGKPAGPEPAWRLPGLTIRDAARIQSKIGERWLLLHRRQDALEAMRRERADLKRKGGENLRRATGTDKGNCRRV